MIITDTTLRKICSMRENQVAKHFAFFSVRLSVFICKQREK